LKLYWKALASRHIKRRLYHRYIHAFSFKIAQKQKKYDVPLRLLLMLQTRVRCTVFVGIQSYHRGILRCSWNEVYITSPLCRIQEAGAPQTAVKRVPPCFTFG